MAGMMKARMKRAMRRARATSKRQRKSVQRYKVTQRREAKKRLKDYKKGMKSTRKTLVDEINDLKSAQRQARVRMPTEFDADIKAAAKRRKKKLSDRRGRTSTILTR